MTPISSQQTYTPHTVHQGKEQKHPGVSAAGREGLSEDRSKESGNYSEQLRQILVQDPQIALVGDMDPCSLHMCKP